jgi:hypothetical protein
MPPEFAGISGTGSLRSLYRPLIEDAHREVEEALKVALLQHHDIPPAEIAERLEIHARRGQGRRKRVAKARERLEQGD